MYYLKLSRSMCAKMLSFDLRCKCWNKSQRQHRSWWWRLRRSPKSQFLLQHWHNWSPKLEVTQKNATTVEKTIISRPLTKHDSDTGTYVDWKWHYSLKSTDSRDLDFPSVLLWTFFWIICHLTLLGLKVMSLPFAQRLFFLISYNRF
jgi:hypothetical protein